MVGPDNPFESLRRLGLEASPMILGTEVPNHYVIHTTSDGVKQVVDAYREYGCLITAAHIHCRHSRVGPVGSMGGFMRSVHRVHDRAGLTLVDALTEPSELVAFAIEHGINVLIPTDHDTQRAIKMYEEAAGGLVRIIPGLELTTSFGHLLVIGYHFEEEHIFHWGDQLRDPTLGLNEFFNICNEIVAFAPERIRLIPAHPNDPKDNWTGPDLHGFEIFNVRSRWNLIAKNGPRKKRVHRPGDFYISGLDAHDLNLLRGVMILPDVQFNIDDPWRQMIDPQTLVFHVLQPVEPLAMKVPGMIREQAVANEVSLREYASRLAIPVGRELMPSPQRLVQAAGMTLAARLALNGLIKWIGK